MEPRGNSAAGRRRRCGTEATAACWEFSWVSLESPKATETASPRVWIPGLWLSLLWAAAESPTSGGWASGPDRKEGVQAGPGQLAGNREPCVSQLSTPRVGARPDVLSRGAAVGGSRRLCPAHP